MDLDNLPPEIMAKLANIMQAVDEREPEGEVSYERLAVLNTEVFTIRKKLLKSQYDGAIAATSNLVEHMENDKDVKNRDQVLKMAIVSLEATIDESKKDLMQSLLKSKFEARKQFKRGENVLGEDMDMLDAIIAAAETEADYNPAEIAERHQTKPKERSNRTGFGFGTNQKAGL